MFIRSAVLFRTMVLVLISGSQSKPQVTPNEDPQLCLYVDINKCNETYIKTQCIHLCKPKTDAELCFYISPDKCSEAYIRTECAQMCHRPAKDEWSLWSPWSGCSTTCGEGQRQRTRSCTSLSPSRNATECPGNKSQMENCNKGQCPKNGTECSSPWFSVNNECFLGVTDRYEWREWAAARTYCGEQAPGADLAQPNNLKAFDDYIVDNGYDGFGSWYWLGGSDKVSEGDWHWNKGNATAITSGWYPGEPNNHGHGEDCLVMVPGEGANSLYDRECGDYGWAKYARFFCERF